MCFMSVFDAWDASIYKLCVLRWDNERDFFPGTSSVSFPSFHVFTIKDMRTEAEAGVKLCSPAAPSKQLSRELVV